MSAAFNRRVPVPLLLQPVQLYSQVLSVPCLRPPVLTPSLFVRPSVTQLPTSHVRCSWWYVVSRLWRRAVRLPGVSAPVTHPLVQ
jgi:hypothetical protein